MQEDLVPIKICKNDPENRSVSQNDVHSSNSRYVKILIDSGVSASTIHESYVRTNKFNARKTSANKWSTKAGF